MANGFLVGLFISLAILHGKFALHLQRHFPIYAVALLPFLWLWFVLINHLRVEWAVNPQYSYGWAVPFLCLFLAWQKISEGRRQKAEVGKKFPLVFFCLLALLYAPTRLVQEANPEWRLVSWALAVEVVGLTLLAIFFASGARGLARFAFPVGFFFVAVPWPTFLEMPLIQGLTRLDTVATTELLGWLGIPALPHGNVIEVATGMVGIDEACSGIRSFQATLMISLFLGELYRLDFSRRAILVLGGFALSFFFNLARMSLLVWVAARKGVAAIASWHDPAGVTILVACFFALWALGEWLRARRQKAEGKNEKAETLKTEKLKATSAVVKHFSVSAFQLSAFILLLWIVAVEISVEAWYRSHEARVPAAAQWTVDFPTNNPAFKELSLPPAARQILRYDEGRSAVWPEGDLTWQAVFLRWQPGSTAVHLAQNHTPDVCLTAAGHTLKSIAAQEWLDVRGLRLPFSVNEVTDPPSSNFGAAGTPRPFFVFYCLWDDRSGAQGFDTEFLTWGSRLAPVRAGLRNPGQRSLEIAVSGADGFGEAETAVRVELEKIIAVQK
jgi:exosortase